jgi:hypothetical protein
MDMIDSIEKLKAIVRELEIELRELSAVDEQAAELLQEAIREIQTVLQSRQLDAPPAVEREPEPLDEDLQPDPSDTVIDQLKHAAHQFEDSHPTLTGILSRLIDGLGQMGI